MWRKLIQQSFREQIIRRSLEATRTQSPSFSSQYPWEIVAMSIWFEVMDPRDFGHLIIPVVILEYYYHLPRDSGIVNVNPYHKYICRKARHSLIYIYCNSEKESETRRWVRDNQAIVDPGSCLLST